MSEAHATIGAMNKLVRWSAGVVVMGGIGWAAYVTTTITAIGSDLAVLKRRDHDTSRSAERIDKLEQAVAAMAAARTQIIEDYRLTIARLEGQIEGQRRDIQELGKTVATLVAKIDQLGK